MLRIDQDAYVVAGALFATLATYFSLANPPFSSFSLFSFFLVLFFLADSYFALALQKEEEKVLSLSRASLLALFHNLYFSNLLSYFLGLGSLFLVFYVALEYIKKE